MGQKKWQTREAEVTTTNKKEATAQQEMAPWQVLTSPDRPHNTQKFAGLQIRKMLIVGHAVIYHMKMHWTDWSKKAHSESSFRRNAAIQRILRPVQTIFVFVPFFWFSEKLFSLFSRRWFELNSFCSSLFLVSLCLSFVLPFKLEISKCIRKNVCALRTSRKVSMRRKLRKECARSERRSLKHGHPRIVLPFQTISKCMRRIHRYSR